MGIRAQFALCLVATAIAGCGGGGGSSNTQATAATYSIGGTVSGLTGVGLVLQNNAGDNLTVGASGAFTFATKPAGGANYSITVLSQPASQICSVTNGSGTVGTANVTNVAVACVTVYTIGGTLSGLAGTLVLQDNSGDNLTLSANGTITFATRLVGGATYSVTVLSKPAGQICSVTNGSGTVGAANVTNVAVACVTVYTIGGTLSGLAGSGLVLQNNAGDNLSVAASSTTFTFATPLLNAATYGVTVKTQPSSLICSVTNGSGTVSGAAVTSVAVLCKAGYSVSAGAGAVTDPLAAQQWHILNTGQNGYADTAGVAGNDINANPVYTTYGFGGKGVTVAVVDSGLEIAHEDLAANVVANGSWNFLNSTTDPTNTVDTTGDHGTSVSGLIAMARNNLGGIGVASEAKLKGFNFLSSTQSLAFAVASLGGSASNPNSSDVHVFNQSFGADNTSDTPINTTVEGQYASGATTLRGGKGALYVKSAGNGFSGYDTAFCTDANNAGVSCDNANFDPDNAIPYQIITGAVNASGIRSSYSTAGSAIWVGAPGGEYGYSAAVAPGYTSEVYQPAMVTTDQSGCTNGYSRSTATTSTFNIGGAPPNTPCNYTNSFNGTSSAAPVTSGVIALILEANPALTWRDVKYILAKTAKKIDASRAATSLALTGGSYVAVPAWITNAAGYNFHNWYGFGVVDAKAAVELARTYPLGQLGTFANTGWIASSTLALAIPDNSISGPTHTLSVPAGTAGVVEAVQIKVSATHPYSGDLAIELTSPSGTRSVLKTGRDGFSSSANLTGMVLLSNAFYGEAAAGNWTIKLVDVAAIDTGTFTGWSIRIYGH